MKKYIVLLFWVLLTMPVLAAKQEQNFQERLYCKVSENAVRVYLLPDEETLRCLDYIAVVNSYLKTEYDVIIQIIANRNRWDDLEYRDTLYEEKKVQFLKLFSQRTMIKQAMSSFEEELLGKAKMFLEETLVSRITELELQIGALKEEIENNTSNYRAKKTLEELLHKKDVVEKLQIASDMTNFLEIFSEYLTLFPFSSTWK